MRLERSDLAQGLIEVALKTNRAIVKVHVRNRFFVRYAIDELAQIVAVEPLFDVLSPADCEDDHAEILLLEAPQEVGGAGARRMKEIGSAPSIVEIEDAVEINADGQRLRHVPIRSCARRAWRCHSTPSQPQSKDS